MKDLFCDDVYTIDVDRWLSRYEDDFDVCRELAVAKSGVQPLPSKGDDIFLLRSKTCCELVYTVSGKKLPP